MYNTKVIGKRITALTMTAFFALSIFGIPYTQTKSVVEAKPFWQNGWDAITGGGKSSKRNSDSTGGGNSGRGDDGMLSSIIMGMMGGIPMGNRSTYSFYSTSDGANVICMSSGKPEVGKSVSVTCLPQITNGQAAMPILVEKYSFEQGGQQTESMNIPYQRKVRNAKGTYDVVSGMMSVSLNFDVYQGKTGLSSADKLVGAMDPNANKWGWSDSIAPAGSQSNPEGGLTPDMCKKYGVCGGGGIGPNSENCKKYGGDWCKETPGANNANITEQQQLQKCKTLGLSEEQCKDLIKNGTNGTNGTNGSNGSSSNNNPWKNIFGDNGFNSNPSDWNKSSGGDKGDSNLDGFFNGVDGADGDIPGGLTDDLLGVGDLGDDAGNGYNNMGDVVDGNGNETSSGDNVGEDYYGGDTNYGGGNHDDGYSGDGGLGFQDFAQMYKDGLNGLDGLNGSNGELLGEISGSNSLAEKLRDLMGGDKSASNNLKSTASDQELFDVANKLLQAAGYSVNDLKNGKTYDSNSAYTEPSTAWDFNRITTLLKKNRIKLPTQAGKFGSTGASKENHSSQSKSSSASEKDKASSDKASLTQKSAQ
jgi:hypothetical protein